MFLTKKEKVIFILSFIIGIVATLNFSVAQYSKNNVEYKIDINEQSKINNITINDTTMPIEDYSTGNLIIEEEQLVAKEDTRISMYLSVVDDLEINFEGDIKVYKSDVEQQVNNGIYLNETSIFNIIASSISWYSLLIFVILYPILFLAIYRIKIFLLKLKNDENLKMINICIFMLAIFVIYISTFYILLATLKVGILALVIGFSVLTTYCIRDRIKEKIEYLYVLLATIFGITMIFSIPPFNVPDEYAHFVKSYASYKINDDKGVTNMPISIENFAHKYIHGMMELDTKYNAKNYFSDLLEDGEYDLISSDDFGYTNTKYLKILPYLPSIPVIYIARLLNFSPLVISLLGRFTSLVLTITLCYIAIKNIPCFKKVMVMVALFPIFLHQSVINQDYLTNVMAMLIVAFTMKYKYLDRKITYKELGILSIFAICLAFCKFGYFPVLLTVFLIPNSNFKDKKTAIIFKILFVVVPLLLSFTGNVSIGGGEESPYYTIKYALTNVLDTIKIYLTTAWRRMELDIFRGLFDGFGVSTKWNYPVTSTIIIAIYLLLIFSSKDKDKKLTTGNRIFLAILSFLIIFIVYTAMFLNWTFLGEETIDGLQPRYFIPAVIMLYLAISNNFIKLNFKNNELFYGMCLNCIYLISFITILIGFYSA